MAAAEPVTNRRRSISLAVGQVEGDLGLMMPWSELAGACEEATLREKSAASPRARCDCNFHAARGAAFPTARAASKFARQLIDGTLHHETHWHRHARSDGSLPAQRSGLFARVDNNVGGR